jgi:hypothetical protein
MFYKKINNGDWLIAELLVNAPDYQLHRDGNREPIDGWKWHDTPTQEYEDFIQAQAEYENWEQTQ